MNISKYELPVLEVNTIENKFKLNNVDLKGVTSLNIKFEGGSKLGEVVMKFDAEVLLEGKILLNNSDDEDINILFNRTAQEVPVQEQSLINFSSQTGEKLHETCPNCWVKNKPYKCGFDKCPGYNLLAIEAIEGK